MRSLLLAIFVVIFTSCGDKERSSKNSTLERIDQIQLYVNVSEREENIIRIQNGSDIPARIDTQLRFQWKNADKNAVNSVWEEVTDTGYHSHSHPTVPPHTSIKIDHFNFRGHFDDFDYDRIYFRVGVNASGFNDDGIYERKTFWGRPILEERKKTDITSGG